MCWNLTSAPASREILGDSQQGSSSWVIISGLTGCKQLPLLQDAPDAEAPRERSLTRLWRLSPRLAPFLRVYSSWRCWNKAADCCPHLIIPSSFTAKCVCVCWRCVRGPRCRPSLLSDALSGSSLTFSFGATFPLTGRPAASERSHDFHTAKIFSWAFQNTFIV